VTAVFPAASVVTTRQAWTPSPTGGATVTDCAPAPPGPATSRHSPEVPPSVAALIWAWEATTPLVASVDRQASVTVPGAAGEPWRSVARGAVRSTKIVSEAEPPSVPSPSATIWTGCTPSGTPSSGRSRPWLPTPGAPVHRTWPATRIRCWPTPSLPKLSLTDQSARSVPAAPIQLRVMPRMPTAGDVVSRTRMRGAAMK
jgi:hypothetical protein